MSQILLNPVDRKLMEAELRLLSQQIDQARSVVVQAQAAFNEAISVVVTSKPMRERPPEDAEVRYDRDQGALVWPDAEPAFVEPVAEPAPEPVAEPAGV